MGQNGRPRRAPLGHRRRSVPGSTGARNRPSSFPHVAEHGGEEFGSFGEGRRPLSAGNVIEEGATNGLESAGHPRRQRDRAGGNGTIRLTSPGLGCTMQLS
jgi:hypothetical protein